MSVRTCKAVVKNKHCQANRPLICSECAKNEPNDVRLTLRPTKKLAEIASD